MYAKKIVILTICLVLLSVVADRPASSRHLQDIKDLMWTEQQIKERNEARERSTEIQDKKIADFENRQSERRARNKPPRPVKPVRQTTSALSMRILKLEQEVEILSDIVEVLLERVAALENPIQEIEAQEKPKEVIIAPGR